MIVGDRSGYLLAAAFPAILCNLVVGQNGFLSAGLFGCALVLLERRPVMAGVLFGLLTYKPHLGLLVPVALIAGGNWRAFVTAGIVAMLMAVASWAAFGTATWQAFVDSIGLAAVCVAVVWRGRATYEVKAATLVTAALLATPYLYTYDLVVLAIPLAFLFRLARDDGFLPHDLAGIGLACALVLIFPFVNSPVGLGAILVVAVLIARRALLFPARP